MGIELTWFGHGCWSIVIDSQAGERHTLLLDPFLTDSPSAPVKAEDVSADFILISHGHFDHISDAAAIARHTGATVISNFEICEWLAAQGVKQTHPHNLGGSSHQKFGRLQLTLAHHSSQLPDGSYGGNPSGFLLQAEGRNLYFACDTALFYDMKLIGEHGIDVAVLPIGDQFTMGPDDAIRAVKLIGPKTAIPSHYDTWAPIAQDAEAWAHRVRVETTADACVLRPGGKFGLNRL